MPIVAVLISLHASLIHGLVCVFFLHIQRNKTKSSHCSNQRQDYPFILSIEMFCHKRKQEKSQDRLGKDV